MVSLSFTSAKTYFLIIQDEPKECEDFQVSGFMNVVKY
jgi:hypothetical protein